jgi:RimJ/RimL family protein N-acetyltransferase
MVLADADELFRVLDDARLHGFTGGAPLTRDELKARIAKWQIRASPDQTQHWLNWVVRIAATGTMIGYVQASVTDQCATIAYVTGTAYSGQGNATEASLAMCAALRERLGVEEFVAHIHPQHSVSRRVARRLGLAPTGTYDADGEELWSSTAAAAGSD